MNPALAIAGAWLLFGGSHLLLSSPWLRNLLCRRLGEHRFVVIYTVIAAVSLTVLAITVARYGDDGLRGLGFAEVPLARVLLGAIALSGAALALAGLMNYPRSPMAVFARRLRKSQQHGPTPLRSPAAVERITRHPFFVGIAVLMGAHALLARTLAGALFFLGFALLALIGIRMQDRKLHLRHGDVYGDYLAASSAVPFAAVHRPAADASERIWPTIIAATGGAVLLGALHPLWRIGYGAPFVVLVLLGGLFAVVRQTRRT